MTTSEKLTQTMQALSTIEDINIELCGTWLWIDGDTYDKRATLKNLGCKWSHNKKRWYWHDPDKKGWSNGKSDMLHIRQRYGSMTIKEEATA